MSTLIDILQVGQVFGQWTVVDPQGSTKDSSGHRTATVRCSCGAQRDVAISKLKGGVSKSCGHRRTEGDPPRRSHHAGGDKKEARRRLRTLVVALSGMRKEIARRRKENHENGTRRSWSPDSISMFEQKRLLDWVEQRLGELTEP